MTLWRFGGILPFIGWRVVNVDNDGHPCEEPGHWEADSFEVEWFGAGIVLVVGEVRPRKA